MRISDWSSDVCSSDLALVIATNQARGHAHALFQFHHRRHEGNFGGKSRVEGLVGNGPGKQCALAAAAFPGKFRRAALCAHIARQVAEAAATTAALEIEIAVLAPLPEFLLNRVLRARSRFRSDEHTSELQSLMRISYAVFCLKKK